MNLKDFYPFNKWIAKKDLEVGQEYFCYARNFEYGTWNGETFDYIREKWGQKFPDVEKHWDDGAPYGTVKPLIMVPHVEGVLQNE